MSGLPTRAQIIAANPIINVVKEYGIELKQKGGELYGLCPFHGDTQPSFRVNPAKQTFFCDPCGMGGSVIDFVMKSDGISAGAAMAKLARSMPSTSVIRQEPKLITTYDYTDENGKLLFQVCRFEPKSFKQRRPAFRPGDWVWSMQGVRRVLYRLPDVIATEEVWLVEGEKDADNLRTLGFVATCNVGGGKKWLDSYSGTLRGKTVVLVPDNDSTGKEHADLVQNSLLGKARALYRLQIPAPDKDASDFIQRHGPAAMAELAALRAQAPPVRPTFTLPIKSMEDLEAEYQAAIQNAQTKCLPLQRWLPQLSCVRPLLPGELVAIVADTGVGKTALLQNLAMHARPLKTLFFEMELPGPLMFERFVQLQQGRHGKSICEAYRANTPPDWRIAGDLDHVFVCTEAGLAVEEIEQFIAGAELKLGEPPALVLIDYIGLLNGKGPRYERISDAAEKLKVVAKRTNTIMVLASQVSRGSRDDNNHEVFLHDAKDSGSIENSAGLVLGAWRDGDGSVLKLKVLKNSKGRAGLTVECRFDGETMTITQQSPTTG